MGKKVQKRIVIVLVYFALFGLMGLFFYQIFKPEETCFDKILNQNEEGVDCGGRCAKKCETLSAKDLIVGKTGLVESSVFGEYDFYGTVSNSSTAYGSDRFNYRIVFKDASGAVLTEKSGESYILPGEEKYIIENNIPMGAVPVSAELLISDPHWVEFVDYYKKPDLKIVNLSYNKITSGIGYYEVKGLLENESPFDFSVIKVKVILRDQSGKIIALNSTAMGTVLSGENRDFRVFWPGRFSGEVGDVETQIEVNVFKSESFEKRFFRSEKFQEYAR